MDGAATTLSHYEISLLLFALQGGDSAQLPDAASCEEACPVVESIEELLCGGQLDPQQQLVRHLNNHLREAMIECGMFELMAAAQPGAAQALPVDDPMKLQQVNERLGEAKLPEGIGRPAMGPVSTGLGEVYHYLLTSENSECGLTELRKHVYHDQIPVTVEEVVPYPVTFVPAGSSLPVDLPCA